MYSIHLSNIIKNNVEKIKDIVSHSWKRIQPIMINADRLANASSHKRFCSYGIHTLKWEEKKQGRVHTYWTLVYYELC